MIKKFHCVNISSKNPKVLVDFYHQVLNLPILEDDENYDGVALGFSKNAPTIMVWDENKWGQSSEGKVNFVFSCDDVERTYEAIKEMGYKIQEPTQVPWGMELKLEDPEGNKILILDE